jgi:trigger factor
MEIAIKNVLDDKLRKDFQLNIPSQLISQKINDYINKIQPEFELEGFNKGQVPFDKIKQQYGKTIMAEQSDLIVSQVVNKIVNDNNYKIASYPKIEFKTFEEGKDINLVASFELFPAIPEIDLNKITLNKYILELSEEELDEMFYNSIKSKFDWVAQDQDYISNFGDIVEINYNGKINNKEFEGSSDKNYRLELGSKTFIDNFEDQLVGKITGEKINVKVTYPNDYFRPELANQVAIFEVEILSILKANKAVINDEFVAKNTDFDNIEEFKDNLYSQTISTYDLTCRAIFKKELFDYLDYSYNIDLPIGLVNEQTNFLKNITKQSDQQSTKSIEQRLNDLKLSQRMVRCGLILADIANKNGIEVTEDDVTNEIDNIVNMYPDQKDQILEMYSKNQDSIRQLQGAILEEKTVNFILDKVNIVDIPVSTKQVDRLWFDISNNK